VISIICLRNSSSTTIPSTLEEGKGVGPARDLAIRDATVFGHLLFTIEKDDSIFTSS
jgi:hypothetical protein